MIEENHSQLDDISDEKIEIDEEMIEVIHDVPDEYPYNSDEDKENEYIYKTSKVAEYLGIHRQTLIQYANTFKEVLDIQKTSPTGDRLYSNKCISQLAFIINDMTQSGRSKSQELTYLKSKYGSKNMEIAVTGPEGVAQMFEEMQAALLLSLENAQKQNMQELLKAFDERTKILEDNRTALSDYEQKLEVQEQRYTEALKLRDDEITKLQKQLDQTKAELENQKKPFWLRKK